MVFATAAARNAALAAVLAEGMFAVPVDTNSLTVYSGTAWSTIGPLYGAWTTYTPTWSGTLVNGTLAGAYTRFGRMIHFRIDLTWGSSTTHPAAPQTFTAPVAAVTSAHGVSAQMTLAGSHTAGSVSSSSTTFTLLTSSAITVTNTNPSTWSTGHTLRIYGTYEAAADA